MQDGQRTRKAFYRASFLAQLSGTLIALTAFCAPGRQAPDGRASRQSRGAARKIDEARVEKGEEDTGYAISLSDVPRRDRNDNKIVTRVLLSSLCSLSRASACV